MRHSPPTATLKTSEPHLRSQETDKGGGVCFTPSSTSWPSWNLNLSPAAPGRHCNMKKHKTPTVISHFHKRCLQTQSTWITTWFLRPTYSICRFDVFYCEICRPAVAFLWRLQGLCFFPLTFKLLFFYITHILCCPASILFLFQEEGVSVFAGLWSLRGFFYFQEKVKVKELSCFTVSEADTHDVISDVNLIYFLHWDECRASLQVAAKRINFMHIWRVVIKIGQIFACLFNY